MWEFCVNELLILFICLSHISPEFSPIYLFNLVNKFIIVFIQKNLHRKLCFGLSAPVAHS